MEGDEAPKPQSSRPKHDFTTPEPTCAEIDSFLSNLSKCGKAAILSIDPAHSDIFERKIPECRLIDLYKEAYPDLLNKYEEVFQAMTMTSEDAQWIEENIRDQSAIKFWFQYRAGRVTASQFRAAAHTDLNQPSLSLIKRICYLEAFKFKTQATAYGCEHEKAARESYAILAQEKHTNFHIRSSGLIVDTACPHLGATPDGWVECDCCGSGVLEIKCPYSCRESAISERASEMRFCLEKDERGKMTLKTAHEYYYQVQAQLYLSHVNFADFVVWNKEEIFLQQIYPTLLSLSMSSTRLQHFSRLNCFLKFFENISLVSVCHRCPLVNQRRRRRYGATVRKRRAEK